MAKSKEVAVRRVRSEEERNTGSADYIQLDDGEKFLGYALFEGDPKQDEPGYFEYMEHWVTGPKSRSVPCAGEDCPYCEEGDRPRGRAKSLWLVLKDHKGTELGKKGEGEVRIFNLNSKIIKQITEMRGEDDKIYGQLFRVSRLDDQGNYTLQPKAGKVLKKGEVKEALKDAPDLEDMLNSQLRKALEGVSIAKAMDDDDDDDDDGEETPAKSKGSAKGKGKAAEPDDDDDGDDDSEPGEWPAEGLDDEEVTVAKVAKDGNWIEVTSDSYEDSIKVWTTDDIEFDLTDLSKGDEVTISTGEKDDDGEYILSGEPETGGTSDDDDDDDDDDKTDDGEGNGLPDAIEDEVFEVIDIDASESTMEVKSDELELEFTLYFLDTGEASKVDFDDYEKGAKIKVTAEKDTAGDLVATQVPEVVKEKKAGGKKGAAKKGGRKGGKKGK